MRGFSFALTRLARWRLQHVIGVTVAVALGLVSQPVIAPRAEAALPQCKIDGPPLVERGYGTSSSPNHLVITNASRSCYVNFPFQSFGVANYSPASIRFSPDGRFIAWVGRLKSTSAWPPKDALFWATSDAKYGGMVAEPNDGDSIQSVAWSPNSDALAFSMMPAGGSQYDLYTIALDGGDLELLTATGSNEQDVDWAGDYIVYREWDSGSKSDIMKMAAAGGSPTRLTCYDPGAGEGGDPGGATDPPPCPSPLPGRSYSPRLSPDGSMIAFHSTVSLSNSGRTAYVMNADGAGLRALSASPPIEGSFSPKWTHDGAYIVMNYGVYGVTQWTLSAVSPFGGGITQMQSNMAYRDVTDIGPANMPPDLAAQIGACAKGQCPKGGDPVNLAIGNVSIENEDIALATAGPRLGLTRTYNNADISSTAFGKGWRTNFDESVRYDRPGSLEKFTGATWTRADGRQDFYSLEPDGSYAPAGEGRHDSIELIDGHFEVVEADSTRRIFDEAGRIASVRDRHSNGYDVIRNEFGRIETVVSTYGGEIAFAYGIGDRIESATTSDGRAAAYGYSSGSITATLASATLPGEQTWTYTYDAAGNLATVTNPGEVTTYSHRLLRNQVVGQVSPNGAQTDFSYAADPAGLGTGKSIVTDPEGNATTDTWDPSGFVTSRTDPEGHRASFEYSAAGDRTKIVDPNGATTNMGYDDAGNLATRQSPNGGTTSNTWRDDHQPSTSTDPTGVVTTFGYNSSGSLTSFKSGSASGNTILTYNSDGSVATATSPDGVMTVLGYDAAGRQNSIRDVYWRETTTDYNPDGTLAMESAPGVNGHRAVTTYDYDSAGRQTMSTDPRDHTTEISYDAAGNVATTSDYSGPLRARDFRYSYDAAHNLKRTETNDGAGQTHAANYAYDGLDRLVAINSEPGAPSTEITYTPAGRISARSDPDGAKTTYTYQPAGELAEEIAADGQVVGYGYDATGNVTERRATNSFTYQFTYDIANRLEYTSSSDGSAKKLDYDESGRATGATDVTYGSIGTPWPAYRTQKTLSPGGRTIDATYERGYVIAGTVPGDGEFNPAETDQVSYEYDSVDGSLLSISSESLIGEVAAVSNTYYNENGYLATRTMPGVTTTFSYDTAGQVVSADSVLAGGTPFSYLTTYNSRGEVTAMGTWTYQYDGAGRMIGAYDSESAVGWTYEYDTHSNRTSATSSAGYAQNLTYSPGDRITSPGCPESTFLDMIRSFRS